MLVIIPSEIFLSFHLQAGKVKRKIPILQNYHYNFILCEFKIFSSRKK